MSDLTRDEFESRWMRYPEALRDKSRFDATLHAALMNGAMQPTFDLAATLTAALLMQTDAKAELMRIACRYAHVYGTAEFR